MSVLKREYLSGITSTAGAFTKNGSRTILGRLVAVKWDVGTLANGVDATLPAIGSVTDTTLLTLSNANADALYFPRLVVHGNTGAALTGTSGGDVETPLIDGYLRLVVAEGGDTLTGGCIVYWLDN